MAWKLSYDELVEALRPGTAAELQRCRPLLAELYPGYTRENDPWNIWRAIHVGDEFPRVPMVDLSKRHRRSIKQALEKGLSVPPEVLKEYQIQPSTPGVKTAETWGRAGSGILFYCPDDATILLLMRSDEVLDPGLWGIPGGALKGTEDIYEDEDLDEEEKFEEGDLWNSACEETTEEIGFPPPGTRTGASTSNYGNFAYTTFLVEVGIMEKTEMSKKITLNWENDDFRWFPVVNPPSGLHPGVRDALARLSPKPRRKEI